MLHGCFVVTSPRQGRGIQKQHIHRAVAQVVGISAAVGFAILINNCILPWYATSSALGMLGTALKGSGQLLGEFYEAFYQACS